MATPDHAREPCPDRILDDIGGAFAMGAIGGSVFHFIRGVYNSPKGERLAGGAQSMRMNAPRTGGSFAVWGGLFSTFDCTLVYLRQKEDPWNSIAAGAATGGFLQLRAGLRSAGRSALFGGVLLALIEGAALTLNKMTSPPPAGPMEDPGMMPGLPGFPAPSTAGAAAMGSSSDPAVAAATGVGAAAVAGAAGSHWFGGWFGKKEEPPKVHSEKLDDKYAPPPIPGFEIK